MSEIQNYGRFYALLKEFPGADKELLVSSFTCGRTTSLRAMSAKEYHSMCASLEARTGWKAKLKQARSLCLKLMQRIGIDTSDWSRVDAFCQHPRIAGKVFARLGVKELAALQVKLRAILRKGGLQSPRSGACSRGVIVFSPKNLSSC